LVAACDVERPLLGLRGTTNRDGPDRGLDADRLQRVDAQLERLADRTDRALADSRHAGAGGGMGFALQLVGAECAPAVELVADAVGLSELSRAADLVITGEGSLDYKSRSASAPSAVADAAAAAIRPCVALAGRVLLGAREMRVMGVESAYSLIEMAGPDQALAVPAESLSGLAERVARTWSR
jgi:glycerate kinase